MSVQVSYKKQIVFGILFLAIALVVIEGLSRIYEFSLPCSIENNPVFKNVDYFTVRWICHDTNVLVHGKAPLYLIKPNQHLPTININSFGFRGPEVTKEKPDDTYRIFVVGGSTTFGFGSTSDHTTIPGFLQKKFNEKNPELNVQVINGGINGADSHREANYIKLVLLEFEPDLFIIYDGINDAGRYDRQIIVEDVSEEDIEQFNPLKFANYPWYRTPFVINKIFFAKAESNAEPGITQKNTMTEQHAKLWMERWKEICELGKSKGYDTIITVQPFEGSETNPKNKRTEKQEIFYRNEQLLVDQFQSLNDVCSKTADLRNIFSNYSEPIFYDGGHKSDFGNEIIAEKFYELALPIVLQKQNKNQ